MSKNTKPAALGCRSGERVASLYSQDTTGSQGGLSHVAALDEQDSYGQGLLFSFPARSTPLLFSCEFGLNYFVN